MEILKVEVSRLSRLAHFFTDSDCGCPRPRAPQVFRPREIIDRFQLARLARFSKIIVREESTVVLRKYSIAGLEDHCVVERKDLADLVHSFATERSVCVNRLRLMSHYPHRLLVITASYSEVKSPLMSIGGSPNRITQSLIAILAGLGIPFLCSETHELGEELIGSYLYQVHLYHTNYQPGLGKQVDAPRQIWAHLPEGMSVTSQLLHN